MANSAMAQSRDEYNAQVSQAQAKVNAAQEALVAAESAFQAALGAKAVADAAVESSKSSLDSAIQNKINKEQELANAQAQLQKAQADYNTLLISDPSWIRPNVEETYYVEVPYTVQVPYVVQETRTGTEDSVVLVPNTEIVTTTTLVPREITSIVPAGLTAKVYNMQGYNNAPPLPTEDRLLFTTVVPNINFNWGGGRVMGNGPYEDTIVNFTGSIYIPESGIYSFYSPADDGTKLIIDGNMIINDWYDKGGGGSTVQTELSAGSHLITLWYYENGGGANVWLYWAKPGYGLEIVPASAFGEQTVTTVVYDEVTTTTEVTTYTEQTITTEISYVVDVTLYREETRYRREDRVRMVPDTNASAPLINNPALLEPIVNAQASVDSAQANLSSAIQAVSLAQSAYDSSVATQAEKSGIIESTSNDVSIKQQELNVAQQGLEAIPPFREPTPTPTPSEEPAEEPTEDVVDQTPDTDKAATTEESVAVINDLEQIAPEELTDIQVEQLVEAALVVFETAEQGSPAYEQALEALAVAAQADDPEIPAELAAIPLLGDVAGAVLDVFNDLGNVGADMSPQQREKAEETVVAAVVVGQVAQMAMGAATTAAAGAVASTGSAGRRQQ